MTELAVLHYREGREVEAIPLLVPPSGCSARLPAPTTPTSSSRCAPLAVLPPRQAVAAPCG